MAARTSLRHIVALALPVVVAELGWFAMAVVDTIMVGPLGAPAIAAVSTGTAGYDFARSRCIAESSSTASTLVRRA